MDSIRTGRVIGAIVCLCGMGMMGLGLPEGGESNKRADLGLNEELIDGVAFCTIPIHDHKRQEWVNPRALTVINETEPNDTIGTANPFTLNASDDAVDINGTNTANENDYFSVHLEKGDILGLAVVRDGGVFDPMITISYPDFSVFMQNDDGIAGIYPLSNPLPGGNVGTDSDACIIAPETGTYYMRVHPWVSGGGAFSEGDYILKARWFRNVFESKSIGSKQFIWLDFTGPTINAAALFGGNPSANLSPLSSFMTNWGLSGGDMTALVNKIMSTMELKLDALAAENPKFDYTLRNSHQHVLIPGTPDVTRMIIGGTIAELGVSTIGIAESIDAGNFFTTETAVLLLDTLSDPSPAAPVSLNNVPLGGSATMIDLVGTALGNMAAHEIGHTFGGWHTEPNNANRCIMDSGAATVSNFKQNFFDVGPDGTFGTADDVSSEFITDAFAAEGVGTTPFSEENTQTRMAYAMSTPVCAANLNGDDAVDGADLGLLLGNWGNPGPTDFSGDGTTNGVDLGLLLGNWGPC
ncbi:MAG: hypothetical protein ACF8GE_10660 [Phycisphaerales bacterium JB043]